MKKRIVSILLCLCMALSLLPISSLALQAYGLWVNGVQFTAAALSVACGSGTAVLDTSTSPYTLRLTNATITNAKSLGSIESSIPLKIVLSGTNTVNDASGYGMHLSGGAVTIESAAGDSGSLTVNSTGSGISLWEDASLTLKSGSVTVNGGEHSHGVYLNGHMLTVSGGHLTATGLSSVSGDIAYSSAAVMAGGSADAALPWDAKNDAAMNTYPYLSIEATALRPTVPLAGENPAPLRTGYAEAPTLAVTGAPDGASFAWYAGAVDEIQIADKEHPIPCIGKAASFPVPTLLAVGTHFYTVYVTADGFFPALRVFTVTVTAAVSVGSVAAPANAGEPYMAPVTLGGGSPVDVAVALNAANTDHPSAELTWPLGSNSMTVEVSALDRETSALCATLTLPSDSPYVVDAAASAALLAAIDSSEAVADAVCNAANQTDNQRYFPAVSAPALVFEAPADAASLSVKLDDSLITGGAGRELSLAAQTFDHSISLSGDSLRAVASDPLYRGKDIVIAVEPDGNLSTDTFTGAPHAAFVPNSGAQFTLETADNDRLPLTIPGGIDIVIALPDSVDQKEFEKTGGILHQTKSGATEVHPADLGSSYAGTAVDLRGFGFTPENGKWRGTADDRGQSRERFLDRTSYRFYCDDDGYVRRGWFNGRAIQLTPPTVQQLDASVWLYVRADGIRTSGPAVVDGQTYYLFFGALCRNYRAGLGGSIGITDELGRLRTGFIDTDDGLYFALPNYKVFYGHGWYKIAGSYYRFDGRLIAEQQSAAPASYQALPVVQPALYANISSCSPVALARLSWQDAADTSWYSSTNTRFILYTAAQLAGLAELVNDGTDFRNKTVTLGDDIDLSGANWTPIGTEKHPFRGSFDGSGKAISNMRVVSASSTYAALFGKSNSARIEDLTVNGSIAANAPYTAGIVGYADQTHIENCQSAVEINIAGDGSTHYYAGGISAYMSGKVQTTIVGCATSGRISVTDAGAASVGGIVGCLLNDRVYNSYHTGDVTVSGSNYSALDTGGIAGRLEENYGEAYIANCYSIGTATKRQTGGVLNRASSGHRPVGNRQAGSVVNCYSYSAASQGGGYYDGTGTETGKTADELRALGGTLNAWLNAPTITLEPGETPFAPWYASETQNDGMPCFTQLFSLTVEGSGSGGTTGGDYAGGEVVPITAGTKSGYRFVGWTSSGGGTFARAGSASTTFTMPRSAAAITANWAYSGGSVATSYTLSFDTNGGSRMFSIRPSDATTVDLTKYTPTRDGYTFTGWYADEELATKLTGIRLTKNRTVYAGWKLANPDTGAWVNPFTDVSEDDWFYTDVALIHLLDWMNGTSSTTFHPYAATTRGMIVTILYRIENEPAKAGACPFNDVKSGSYCEKAITWAAAGGIVLGYGDGRFGPSDPLTRQQMAAILWRYAAYKGLDVSAGTDLAEFGDARSVSGYAIPAMRWVCGAGIMQGSAGNLLPTGRAQRCHAAAMLVRFRNTVGA